VELFVLIILIGAAIAYLAYRSHQRTIETWRRVAAGLGLRIESRSGFSRPVISGTLNGLPVKIDTYTQSHGKSSTTYTRYQVRYPSAGFDFSLKREGGLSFIGKFLGFRDIELGDPVFDGAFTIKTSDRQRLLALLTPSVRSGLFRLMASYPSAVITEDHIGMTRAKFETNGDTLASSIQRIVATAQLLTAPSAGVSDTNVTEREEGLLDQVADRMRQAIERHPEDVDQRIFEVETLSAAGKEEGARERVAELEKLAPADPDVTGWKKALGTPVTSKPVTTVDVDEMAKDLFSGNDLSFETLTKFNSTYAGVKVAWEGSVKRVRKMGNTATVTVTVATVSNDLYGNTEIDVLAEMPVSSAPEETAVVTVSGILVRIDPLVRNIYMENASVT